MEKRSNLRKICYKNFELYITIGWSIDAIELEGFFERNLEQQACSKLNTEAQIQR